MIYNEKNHKLIKIIHGAEGNQIDHWSESFLLISVKWFRESPAREREGVRGRGKLAVVIDQLANGTTCKSLHLVDGCLTVQCCGSFVDSSEIVFASAAATAACHLESGLIDGFSIKLVHSLSVSTSTYVSVSVNLYLCICISVLRLAFVSFACSRVLKLIIEFMFVPQFLKLY